MRPLQDAEVLNSVDFRALDARGVEYARVKVVEDVAGLRQTRREIVRFGCRMTKRGWAEGECEMCKRSPGYREASNIAGDEGDSRTARGYCAWPTRREHHGFLQAVQRQDGQRTGRHNNSGAGDDLQRPHVHVHHEEQPMVYVHLLVRLVLLASIDVPASGVVLYFYPKA